MKSRDYLIVFSAIFMIYVIATINASRITDPATLAKYADDWGHTVRYFPSAIVKPSSDQEVSDILLEAHRKREQITVRGRGHSAAGQSQCCGCVVMDMSNLNSIRAQTDDYIYVEAGAQWRVVLDAVIPQGKTTIVQTDWPGLSVGGVLSGGGGLGPGLFRHGRIADNILELTIVTGKGDIVIANSVDNNDLFRAALNGMGQFGVITAVKLPIIDIPGGRIRVYNVYQSMDTLFGNYSTIFADVDSTPFDQLETFPVLNFPSTGAGLNPAYGGYFSGLPGLWVLIQEYGVFYDVGSEPNDAELLSYFDHVQGSEQVRDMSYAEWIYRLDFVFGVLLPSKDFNYAWKNPHPWFEAILPIETAEEFITDLFTVTPPTDTPLYSVQSIIPLMNPTTPNTFQLLPDSEQLVYIGLLRQVDIDSVSDVYSESVRLFDVNGDLRRDAIAVGGKPMITSTLPASPSEWKDIYGDDTYNLFRQMKQQYDPRHILGNSYRLWSSQLDPCVRNGEKSTFSGTF